MNLNQAFHKFSYLLLFPFLFASSMVASAAPALPAKPPEVTGTAHSAAFDMSGYVMEATNGGRGGLPEVRLWLRQSQVDDMHGGGHGWNYPAGKPDNMHYSSWIFWQCGVSDALLQLISEQVTDPSHGVPQLGRYFSTLKSSGTTGWSKLSAPPSELVLDITDAVPMTESVNSRCYITYGISPEIFFSGKARFLLTCDKEKHLTVSLISSTLPAHDTGNLQSALEGLDGHPLFSFPDSPAGQVTDDKIQIVAEFILERQPGKLKLARR